jgi:CRISPR-associated endoribonuclease Cas6
VLTALVLTLKPTTAATVPEFLARAAHAWFLDQISQLDPQLAQRLHQPNRARPFTVSSLWCPTLRPEDGSLRLSPERRCHLRITSVEAALSSRLMNTLARRWTSTTLHLTGVPFEVTGVASTRADHPRAAYLSYEALAERIEGTRPPRHVTLRFLTSTTFRRSPAPDAPFGDDAYSVPLPVPELLFGGLRSLWDTFAPHPLPDELETFSRNRVVVSRYRLRTELVTFGSGRRGRVGGFVGQCRFAILDAMPLIDPAQDGSGFLKQRPLAGKGTGVRARKSSHRGIIVLRCAGPLSLVTGERDRNC